MGKSEERERGEKRKELNVAESVHKTKVNIHFHKMLYFET